ncbi:variable surface lipoprotein [Metamycoplasma hominis]|uniref:variable surface lipoprotein n=1 Tax=Metamycoplasma hominis TaxID=2098 RepID=UPI0022AB1084|nr:variable surface lipoprotein [Metamycoplasma hominis]MCZ2781726.1 variable surface lipoprotein [Metamycoplasma hominis]
MKKHTKILLALGSVATSVFAIPLVAAGCVKTKKPEVKPEEPKKPEDKPGTTPEVKPEDPSHEEETNKNDADKYGEESISKITWNAENLEFIKKVLNNLDKYKILFERNNKNIMAFEGAYDFKNQEFAIAKWNSKSGTSVQLVNPEKPLRSGDKLNSKLLLTKDEKGNFILKYKVAIFKQNGKHIISNKVYESNLGNLDSGLDQVSEEDFKEVSKNLVFDYPNKQETYIKDADTSKVFLKTIKENFSIVKESLKITKNTGEDGTYDLTILYYLSYKNKQISSQKYIYEIKGFKLTPELQEKIDKARKELKDQIEKTNVLVANAKSYQDILKNKQINNFDKKPNFAVQGYDQASYSVVLSNLKVEDKKITLTLTLSSLLNKEISESKTIEVKLDKFANGLDNIALLSPEKQDELLNKALETSIYPFYSKDKYYISKKSIDKLENKSYWINNKNSEINYTLGELKFEGDKCLINLTVSFKDYENSTKKSKFVEIDLSKLGVDEYNKIRKQNNETEIEDQQAPTSTIEDQDVKELNKEAFLKYFKEQKATWESLDPENSITSANQSLSEKQAQLTQINGELDELKSSISELKDSLEEVDDQLKKLQNEDTSSMSQEQKQLHQQKISESQSKKNEIEVKVNEAQTKYDQKQKELQPKIDKLNKEIDELNNNINKLNKELASNFYGVEEIINPLTSFNLNPIDIVDILSKDIEKEMIEKGDNYISVQNFDYDKTTLKLKHSMFAFEYKKHMVDVQNVYIFSFPEIENNKVKSIRVSVVSLQDFQNNDFSNMSSKRVNVNEKVNEDKDFMQKIVLKEHFRKSVTVKYIGDKKTIDEAIKDDISKFKCKLPEELTFEKISVEKYTNENKKEYIKCKITAKWNGMEVEFIKLINKKSLKK